MERAKINKDASQKVTADELFKGFEEDTGITLSPEEIEAIKNKTKKLYPEFTPDELAKIEYYERWNAENEKAREKQDGEITLDKYGNFDFKFYKDEEEVNDPGSSIFFLII